MAKLFMLLTSNKDRESNIFNSWGCGDDRVVSVFAFYSGNPSSYPADVYSFFWKNYVWKQKEAGLAHF